MKFPLTSDHDGVWDANGHGVEVGKDVEEMVRLANAYQALFDAGSLPVTAAGIQWPKNCDVGRVGDMAPPEKTHMRVMLDGDSDICVEIWDAERGEGERAGIEFCTPASGGKSPRTRAALIAVMVAMEEDNRTTPRGQFPPLRSS